MERPDFVEEEHLEYLDELRKSGATNMFGAGPYVQNEFGLDKNQAREVVLYWMESFDERNPRD